MGKTAPTLTNIANGRAVQAFADAFAEVVANIADPNTPATATRKVILEFTIKPNVTRSQLAVTVQPKTTLAKPEASAALLYAEVDKGEFVVSTTDPKQGDFIGALEEATRGGRAAAGGS